MGVMGVLPSVLRENFPSKPKWTSDQVPDLSGKVILITGGNTGLGKECAKICYQKNARVYIACRSQDKAKAAVDELKQVKSNGDITALRLDLADLPTIKSTVDDFLSKEKRLDVLFNNGAIMMPELDLLTKQGYDIQFGTNVIGHFLLTRLLLPTLIQSAKSAPEGKVRVVNTSSWAHYMGPSNPAISYDTMKDGPARRKYTTTQLYGQSKIGNIFFSNELARRYGDQGIVSISLNPGNIKTDLWQHKKGVAQAMNLIMYDTSVGVIGQLYAGTAPEALSLNGKYLATFARPAQPRPDSGDPKTNKELWEWLEEQTKAF